MKALVVEGDRLKRRFLAKVLGARGFEPGECEDAETALQCLRPAPAPLVLIGHTPPRLDALGLCRRLKTNPAVNDAVLVVAAWASTPALDPAALIEAGIDDFVTEAARLDLLELRLAVIAARLRRSTGRGVGLRCSAGAGVTDRGASSPSRRDFFAGMTLANILDEPASCSAGGIRWEPAPPRPEADHTEAGFSLATSASSTIPAQETAAAHDLGHTRAPEEPAMAAVACAAPPPLSPSRQCVRALVADQNAVHRKVTARMLRDLGCQVDVASSGPEAVALAVAVAETSRYDIAFIDCQLAGMNAGEITAEIHRRQTDGPAIPIIAITAHPTRGEREHCLNAGASGYLSRPVTKDDLRAALARSARPPIERHGTRCEPRDAGAGRPHMGSSRAAGLAP